MLKKLLATTALIAIGATSLHSAFAADAGDRSEVRQLVIEPAGTKAPVVADAAKADAGKDDIKQFILKQGNGIETPTPTLTAEATADAGAIKDKPKNELIVTPPGGIPSPGADAGAPPAPATPAAPAADAGAPAAPAGGAPADAPAADAGAPAAPAADAGAPVAPVAPAAPAAAAPADAGAPAADAAPAAGAAPAAPAAAPATAEIKNPKDLFNVLKDKGFGVEIVKKEANGDFLYHVTIPGNDKDGYLLTVDGEYGKVKTKTYISAYDYSQSFSYHAPKTYTPSYDDSPAYGSDDNCDYGSDYSAGY